MSEEPTPPSPETAADAEAVRVAASLEGLRAAVRQRQGELASARGGGGDELALQLAELRRREFVEEPAPVSPRPWFGRLVVFARKVAWHLGFKWHARAVWAQQNGFNQAASRTIQDLAERERETRRRIERLEARLAELERRGGGGAGAAR
jgi:hypothetical protein